MLHDHATMLDNHNRFVRRVVKLETVWGLNNGNGFAWCESSDEDDRDVIMFWSDRAYAERAQQQSGSDCTVDSITLFDFLFRWLPGMARDGVLAGANWTADLAGIESDPDQLQDEILEQMSADMIARYRDQLEEELGEEADSE